MAAWNHRPAILAERQRAVEEMRAKAMELAKAGHLGTGRNWTPNAIAAAIRALALPDDRGE